MITAREALALPSAQLDDEQLAKVDQIIGAIYEKRDPTNPGFEFKTDCADPSVLHEVAHRLGADGVDVHVAPIVEQSRLTGNATCVGYTVTELDDTALDAVRGLLAEVERGLKSGGMKRHGFEFSTNTKNPAMVLKLVNAIENTGFRVSLRPVHKFPRVQGGMVTLEGFTLTCSPSRESETPTGPKC